MDPKTDDPKPQPEEPVPKGPKAMLGFAKRFRETRTTAAWMAELRAGES